MSSVPNKTALTSLAGGDEFYVVDKSDTTDGASGTGKKATVDTLMATVKQALQYTFSTTTTAGDPGAGTMRFNNATPGSVTAIYIDDESSIAGLDLGTVYDSLDGHRVLIVQANDSSKFLLAEVTADADSTGYWTLTVAVEDSGTLPDDSATVTMMVFPGPGGGGGGGTTTKFLPAREWTRYATNGAGMAIEEFATNDINLEYFLFDSTTEEFVGTLWTPPSTYDGGTITFKDLWTGATGASASDTVEFKHGGRAAVNDAAIDQANGTSQVISDALLAVGDWHITGATPAVTLAGTPGPSVPTYLFTSRNVSGTDDMAEDAKWFGTLVTWTNS